MAHVKQQIFILTAVCLVMSHAKGKTTEESNSTGSCIYDDDMCSVPTPCLARYEFTRRCEYIRHSTIYKTGNPSTFQIKLYRNFVQSYEYPDVLKVSVIRAKEGSLIPTDDCCNLEEDSYCILQHLTDEVERYMAFAPIYRDDESQEYCHIEIKYQPPLPPRWCKENPETPCVYMEDDIPKINGTYITLSSFQDVLPSFEFCMFHAPRHFVSNETRLLPHTLKPVSDVTLETSDDDTVHGKDFESKCKRFKSTASNLTQAMMSENIVSGYIVCTVFRLTQFNEEWDGTPLCLSEPGRATPKYLELAIISAVSITCVLIICMALRRLYKKVHYGGLAGRIRIPSTISDQVMAPCDESIMAGKDNDFEYVERYHGRYVAILQTQGTAITIYDLPVVEEEVYSRIPQEKPILHVMQNDDGYSCQEKTPTKATIVVDNYRNKEITSLLESTGSNYIQQLSGSNTTLGDSGYVGKSFLDDSSSLSVDYK